MTREIIVALNKMKIFINYSTSKTLNDSLAKCTEGIFHLCARFGRQSKHLLQKEKTNDSSFLLAVYRYISCIIKSTIVCSVLGSVTKIKIYFDQL